METIKIPIFLLCARSGYEEDDVCKLSLSSNIEQAARQRAESLLFVTPQFELISILSDAD